MTNYIINATIEGKTSVEPYNWWYGSGVDAMDAYVTADVTCDIWAPDESTARSLIEDHDFGFDTNKFSFNTVSSRTDEDDLDPECSISIEPRSIEVYGDGDEYLEIEQLLEDRIRC